MLSPFLVSLPKTPIPSSFPLLTNPPTPTSLSLHSLTLGHQAFTRPRAPPLTPTLPLPLLSLMFDKAILCYICG